MAKAIEELKLRFGNVDENYDSGFVSRLNTIAEEAEEVGLRLGGVRVRVTLTRTRTRTRTRTLALTLTLTLTRWPSTWRVARSSARSSSRTWCADTAEI